MRTYQAHIQFALSLEEKKPGRSSSQRLDLLQNRSRHRICEVGEKFMQLKLVFQFFHTSSLIWVSKTVFVLHYYYIVNRAYIMEKYKLWNNRNNLLSVLCCFGGNGNIFFVEFGTLVSGHLITRVTTDDTASSKRGNSKLIKIVATRWPKNIFRI